MNIVTGLKEKHRNDNSVSCPPCRIATVVKGKIQSQLLQNELGLALYYQCC